MELVEGVKVPEEIDHYVKGLAYKITNNTDMMKYYLMKAIELKHHPSAFEMGKQFMIEGNKKLTKEYLDKAIEFGSINAIQFYICYHLDNIELLKAYDYIEQLLAKKNDATFLDKNVIDKIFECMNKTKLTDMGYGTDYSDIMNIVMKFISDVYPHIEPSVCVNYYNTKLVNILILLYEKINRDKKPHTYLGMAIKRKLCKRGHMSFSKRFGISNRNAMFGYIMYQLNQFVPKVLPDNNADIISEIRDFSKNTLNDDKIFMDCCHALGKIKEQRQSNSSLVIPANLETLLPDTTVADPPRVSN